MRTFPVLGLLLAFLVPVFAHAEMPGQPCAAERIGTTMMSEDRQSIIACLLTGKSAPSNVQEWKSMSSQAKNPAYSLSCQDWQAKNHESMDACIRDGRWHLVYSHDGSGRPTFGSYAQLISYARDGADVKSGDPGASAGGVHGCDAFGWSAGVGVCMGTYRVAGNVYAGSVTKNDGQVYLGTAARRSDGKKINVNIIPTSPTGATAIDAFMRPEPAALDWYVRF